MIVNTSRFGSVQVNPQRVIDFPKGILGFESCKRFVLLQGGQDTSFFWLQAVQIASLALVVTDPALFVPSYQVVLTGDLMEELDLEAPDQGQVFIIVNKYGNVLTGNLQGPLVINVKTRTGAQVVLTDRRSATRVVLVELESPVQMATA